MNLLYFVAALLLPLWWLASRAWKLLRNYQQARHTGLPLVICPVDPDNVIYIIIKVPLGALLRKILPTSLYDHIKVSIFGWEFKDKHKFHEKVGPAFVLVTTGFNELWCADPAMAQTILARRKDFIQSAVASKVMSFLGQNILTSDGESWARQRRIVAPNLNERISEVVWKESTEQANQMAHFLLAQPNGESRETVNSLRAVTINVLGQVGYGQPKAFRPMALPRDPSAKMTYIEAINLVTELLVVAAFVPPWLLSLPIWPKVLQTLGAARNKLPSLTKDMLDQERQRAATQPDARDNIMSMLVKLSDQGKTMDGGKPVSESGQYLTEDEIAGNLFIFTGAGYDTTANTLSYALVLLAAHPELQTWIQEEVDEVLGPASQAETPDYSTAFPKLTRCLALMFETLRLFPPLLHISRATSTSQTITVGGKTHLFAGAYKVYVNVAAVQSYPAIWGDDTAAFKPTRWIAPENAAVGQEKEAPKLITPARGTFLPWSGGPRVCPGQKMSQVEFITVVATLFRHCRVEPVVREGESLPQARARLMELVQDSQPRLTLQMNKPDEVHLRWLRR